MGLPLAVLAILCVMIPCTVAGQRAPSDTSTPTSQQLEYRADANKTIVELQMFRETATKPIEGINARLGTATLINLNPKVNVWFLLRLHWNDPEENEDYHLENPLPENQRFALSDDAAGLEIINDLGKANCALWAGPRPNAITRARQSGVPYASLCGDRLYLRNSVAGTFTVIERVTQLLRDHVWGGDRIVTFVREHAYQDAFAEIGGSTSRGAETTPSASMPRPAQVRSADMTTSINPPDLGIDLNGTAQDLLLGSWYAVNHVPGVFFSLMRPSSVDEDILDHYRNRVNALDSVESQALDYLVAMDLTQFDLHFALGTDHPRVGWSERALPQVRDPRMSGPDGIDTPAPLVVNGIVSPALVARTVATFTAGFKREHGAFRYGSLALINHASHYGFIERGVVFSKLQPGLATLYTRSDGLVDMKTWTTADDGFLDRIQDARQNGVPLIDFDADQGISVPGSLVNQWGAGNWSGSESEQLRTLRAGACLQETASRRFLIFGYFSTATPSAMARVFQAYGCRYAMLLDINALEHTYFALYTREGGHVTVQHLIQGMAVVDRKGGDQLAPRFLSFPDDRDFFYLTRREPRP